MKHFMRFLRKKAIALLTFVLFTVAIYFLLKIISSVYESAKIPTILNLNVIDLPNFTNISEIELEFNYDYNELIKHLNLKNNTFPFFGFPFIGRIYEDNRHVFRGLSDFVYGFRFNNLIPENVKCGNIILVRSEYIKDFVENYHPVIKYPYILITQEHDINMGASWQLDFLNDNNVITWFAQNALVTHPKLQHIPIGVVPRPGYTFDTLADIARKVIPFHEKKFLLYINFTPTTNNERIKTLKHFQKIFGNNSKVKIETTRTSWEDYLINMKNSRFVLSPPGNGVDCYRTWEALILGSVPIVIETGLEPVYGNLPVMIVHDWTEVVEENLQRFQNEKLTAFSKDGFPWRSRIWLRYWITRIVDVKINYINRFC